MPATASPLKSSRLVKKEKKKGRLDSFINLFDDDNADGYTCLLVKKGKKKGRLDSFIDQPDDDKRGRLHLPPRLRNGGVLIHLVD